jgi:GAF domain-containing protein
VPDRDLQILRLIDEGTAARTGMEFFRELVKGLAQALESRYAFVSSFSDDHETVELLAFWTGDGLQEGVTYPLKGTPCEQVLAGEIVAHERDVVELFPLDREGLAAMNAQAYLAIPLSNPDGRVIGHLAVIATEPKNWVRT